MTFWRRNSFGEAKLDFVKIDVSYKRELLFEVRREAAEVRISHFSNIFVNFVFRTVL